MLDILYYIATTGAMAGFIWGLVRQRRLPEAITKNMSVREAATIHLVGPTRLFVGCAGALLLYRILSFALPSLTR